MKRGAGTPHRLLHSVRNVSPILGRTLRSIREEANVSQERLAERASVARTYIGRIERGEMNPTLVTVGRILRAVGVTWKEFGEILDREFAAANESRGAGRARRPPGRRGP
jgi:transcriptional regulator with XRE-family HTH domain